MCPYTVHVQCVWSFPLTLHGYVVNRKLQALPTAHHLHRVPLIVIQLMPCEQSLRSFTCRERGPKSHTAASFLSYQYSTVYLTGLVLSLTHIQIQTHTHSELTGHIYKLKRLQRECRHAYWHSWAYLHMQTQLIYISHSHAPTQNIHTETFLKENRDAYICCSSNTFCEPV